MCNITFEEFDKFGRKPFAIKLTNVITKFYPFHKESFVLSLNATFGSGKTTFLKMWQHELKESHKIETIYINAWDNDFNDEPLLHILNALLDHTTAKDENLRKGIRLAVGTLALTGMNMIAHHTGFDPKSAHKEVEKTLNEQDVQKLGESIYQESSFKSRAYKQLKTSLTDYVKTLENKPLVVMVDELDRTRPDYSVKFLEAIKHIFPVQGICFVLGVDKIQLEKSVKQLYGEIDFSNYYRRFITREANLPQSSLIDSQKFIEYLSEEFFDEKKESGIKFAFQNKDTGDVQKWLSMLVRVFSLTPREIEDVFRVFTQFMAIESDKFSRLTWVNAAALLIVLSVKDSKLYKRVGTQVIITSEEINKTLVDLKDKVTQSNLLNKDFVAHQLLSTFSAFTLADSNKGIIEVCLPTILGNNRVTLDGLSKAVNDFGEIYEISAFQDIYQRLESWSDFL